MRILRINGKNFEVQMDIEELDRAVWHELQDQWSIGYDCGRNDQEDLNMIENKKTKEVEE